MRAVVISELAILAALVPLLVLGARSWWPRSGQPGELHDLLPRVRSAWQEDPLAHRVALGLIILAAALIRIHHLRQPMRLDEAWTYLAYASRSLRIALSDYSYPNNHLFHTFLVWLSTRLVGASEWGIRLPALLFGMMLIPLTYLATRLLSDREAGLLAAALASVFPALILYSTNARGYTLLCCIFVALVCLADRLLERDGFATWLLFSTLVAIGMYTSPIMLYPAGAACAWMILEAWRRGGSEALRALLPRLLWCLAIATLLTAAALTPVVLNAGVAPLVSNRFVTALSPSEFLRALPQFARDLRASLGLGLAWPVLSALMLLSTMSLTAGNDRQQRRTLLLGTALWCVLVLFAMRRPPFARVWLFLLPAWCLYIAVGLSTALAWISRRVRRQHSTLALLAAGIIIVALGGDTLRRRSVFETTETGAFKNGPGVAEMLSGDLRRGDLIVATAVNAPSLDYYLLRIAGLRLDDFSALGDSGSVYAVVNRQYDQTLDVVRSARSSVPWSRLELVRRRSFSDAEVYTFRRRATETRLGADVVSRALQKSR